MLYFAQQLMKCDFDAMKTYTIEGEGAMINGVSYYPLYASSIVKIVNESFNPYDVDLTVANVNVVTPEVARTFQKPGRAGAARGTGTAGRDGGPGEPRKSGESG